MITKEQLQSIEEILKNKKILVIDDVYQIRWSIQMAFDSIGLEISTAANGQEALDLLKFQPNFDLIMTDFKMPCMNGLEFIEQIINNPNLTTCKSIILQTSVLSKELVDIVDDVKKRAKAKDSTFEIECINKSYLATVNGLFTVAASLFSR